MVGYSRAEIMQKPCSLSFMYGDQTDPVSIQRIQFSLDNNRTEQTEIGLHKKNSKFTLTMTVIGSNEGDINKNDSNKNFAKLYVILLLSFFVARPQFSIFFIYTNFYYLPHFQRLKFGS